MKKPLKQRIQKALRLCKTADERGIFFLNDEEPYAALIMLTPPKKRDHVYHTIHTKTIAGMKKELARLGLRVEGGIRKTSWVRR